ncbi:TilS substrate C-terminal domain-containing protein [Spirosoma profusum]
MLYQPDGRREFREWYQDRSIPAKLRVRLPLLYPIPATLVRYRYRLC